MAVAKLTRVVVRSPPSGLGALLAHLIAFGKFHPSRREGMSQDITVILLTSRALAVYGWATELLAGPAFNDTAPPAGPAVAFQARTVEEMLRRFEEDLEVLDRNIPLLSASEDRQTFADQLRRIREASLAVFHALERILVAPGPAGEIRIEGYVPTGEMPAFRRSVGAELESEAPVLRREPGDPYVPTLLVNPRVVALFERFTLQRGIPLYSEIDPTPLVALVFPIFFGLMFGDLGHGLVLLAFGLGQASRPRYAYWGQLLAVFGIVASLVGLLRGVVFGVTFPTPLAHFFAIHPAFNATFTLAYIPLLVEFAVLIGTFHLTSAYVISILNQLRSGRYRDALWSGGPTLVLYASLVAFGLAVLGTGFRPWTVLTSVAPTPFFLGFLGLDIPVADVALASLPLIGGSLALLAAGPAVTRYRAAHRLAHPGRAVLDGLLEAFSRPVEFTMNTLSYIRLAALLVTNTLLGSLVAGVLAYGWAGVALAGVLNIALMAMEGLIVYLQDMRLHLFEWFSKFYAGTGTAFAPLTSEGTFVRLEWG